MAPSPRTYTGPGSCRRHWSMVFVFSPPPGGGIQVYPAARDGTVGLLRRCSPPSVGVQLDFLSCMVDVLLNTSFLDDMGDRSKSKIGYFHFEEHLLFMSILTHLKCDFSIFLYINTAKVTLGENTWIAM